MKEEFNPKDEQYKEVADLPPEHQEDYMDLKGGGFIGREAIINKERAYEMAHTEENKIKCEKIAEKLNALTLQELAIKRGLEYIPLSDGKALVMGRSEENEKIGTLVWENEYPGNSNEFIFNVEGTEVRRSFREVCLCGYGRPKDGCAYSHGVNAVVEECREAISQYNIDIIIARRGKDAPFKTLDRNVTVPISADALFNEEEKE